MTIATLIAVVIALVLLPVTRIYGRRGLAALPYFKAILMRCIAALVAWGYYYLKFKKRIIP